MKASFSLSIPKPCSENWNSFKPTATGGFCDSCQKNVIDFTKASDAEIIAFIQREAKQANAPSRTCGRFRSDQLVSYSALPTDKIHPGFTLLKAGVISLFMLLITKPSLAQGTAEKLTYQTVSHPVIIGDTIILEKKHVIKGRVNDAYKYPLPGISVVQKGTRNGTNTGVEGEFELTLLPDSPQVLVFSFIGMKTKEFDTQNFSGRSLEIVMEDDPSQLVGELIIMGEPSSGKPYAEHASPWKRFCSKIKSWF